MVQRRDARAVLEARQVARRPGQPVRRPPTSSAPEQYVNAPPDEIRGRLTGVYDLGADLGEKDFAGDQMRFFRDGEINLPRRAHAIWALAQYQRFGLPRRGARPTRRSPTSSSSPTSTPRSPRPRASTSPTTTWRRSRCSSTASRSTPPSPTRRRTGHDQPEDHRRPPSTSTVPVPVDAADDRRAGAPPPIRRAGRGRARRRPRPRLGARRLRRPRRVLGAGVGGQARRPPVARRRPATQLRELLADPFYDNGPQRQGHRPPAARLAAAGVQGLRARRRWSASRSGSLIGASRRAWLAVNPVDPAAAAGVAAGLVPDLADRLPGRRPTAAVSGDLHHRAVADGASTPRPARRRSRATSANVARVFRFGRVAYLRHVLVPHSAAVDRHRPAAVDGHRLDGDRRRRDALGRRRASASSCGRPTTPSTSPT